MADVNPNQDLRFKEIMKRIIPAGYLFSYIYLSIELFSDGGSSESFQNILGLGRGLNDVVSFAMLTILVYVAGFVINYIAS